MARPKEFERDTALAGAIEIFAEHGYEGTSTDDLLASMGISRQSMYDTFGGKWKLYLEALQRYNADSISAQLRVLNAAPSALAGLVAHLEDAVERAIAAPHPTCLGVSAICEFGRLNPDVTLLTDTADGILASALEHRLAEARAAGEIGTDIDIAAAGNFIKATLTGIKVVARAGASPETLRGIARMAIRSLR